MYTMRKFPTPGAEHFGKGRSNPHPVPGGGGEWGISLIPALCRSRQAERLNISSADGPCETPNSRP